MLIICFMLTVFLIIVAVLKTTFSPQLDINARISRDTPKRKHRKSKIKKRRDKGNRKSFHIRYLESLRDELYVTGIKLKPEEFIAIWWGGGIGIPLLTSFLGVGFTTNIGITVITVFTPIFYVKMQREKMLKKLDGQLVDGISIICNSLRAGHSFQTAVENISKEMSDPIAREFKRVADECRYGISLEQSLKGLTARTGNQDLELITSAVLIQKSVGGNLAEVLENISSTIKDRIKLRGDIKVMTSQGRLSGYIIGALPVILLLMLMVFNPAYIESFFTTKDGKNLIMIAIALECIGFIFVKKIVSIKF